MAARVRRPMPRWAASIIGAVAIIAVWWLFSATAFTPAEGTDFTPVPSPWVVFSTIAQDGLAPY